MRTMPTRRFILGLYTSGEIVIVCVGSVRIIYLRGADTLYALVYVYGIGV